MAVCNSDEQWPVFETEEHPRSRINPLSSLEDPNIPYLRICAPMVRYSKLPFREVTRAYATDIAFTPMILSDVFKNSTFSQDIEYQTNSKDEPVIVQFAAANAKDLGDAAELVAKYSNGVDLNCGCPQKWAVDEGIGSYLMTQPERVREMIRSMKSRTTQVKMSDGSSFPCSIKIRCVSAKDPQDTVEFARRAEKAGASFITLHGRTRRQKTSEPVNLDVIRLVKESINIPLIANGDVFTSEDADRVVEATGVDGVMSARGMLENPALFAGYDTTPREAVQSYIDAALAYGTDQFIFHQHLIFMLDKTLSKNEKKLFNCLSGIPAVLDYLEEHFGIIPRVRQVYQRAV